MLIDVLCDTTTLVTSVSQGRQTIPSPNAPAALQVARTLRDPLLAASDTETWRAGFEMFNSPAALAARTDARPLVLSCWIGAALAENAHAWPVSILLGAAALLAADVLARLLLAPQEIPVGIITALAGAPFFLWVLRRSKNQGYW